MIVTADHSHSITFNGYPERGNPILGTWMEEDKKLFARFNSTDLTPGPTPPSPTATGPAMLSTGTTPRASSGT